MQAPRLLALLVATVALRAGHAARASRGMDPMDMVFVSAVHSTSNPERLMAEERFKETVSILAADDEPKESEAPKSGSEAEVQDGAEGEARSKTVAVVLSVFLGIIGADRLYLGLVYSAAGKLFTLGGLGIWWVVDILLLLMNELPDRDGVKPT